MTADEIFAPRDQNTLVPVFQYLTGRWPTTEEYSWIKEWSNRPTAQASVHFGISPRFDSGRKTIVFYSACHAIQLLHFFYNWSRTGFIHDVNWLVLFAGTLDLDIGRENRANAPFYFPMFETALAKADQVVYTPMFRSEPYSPSAIRQRVRPASDRWFSFHAPSFAGLWPACPNWGDEHIVDCLKNGWTPNDIKVGLRNNTLPCRLQARWAADFARLQRKDEEVQVGLVDFFFRHWKKHRMFSSFNHASYALIAHVALRLEKLLTGDPAGVSGSEEEFCLSGAQSAVCEMGNPFPDHQIVVNELGIEYSGCYPDTDFFYEKLVDQIATDTKRWKQ